ncbi:MAG: class beta-lactamase-related serine hydrolase [Myxococcales bacterium]|nr:class beta-lactamase-related serine hydrolase [Myxococcales bacterium]
MLVRPPRWISTKVRKFAPSEVTSINPAEADPSAGGLARGDVDEIWRAVVRLYETGLHPAIALCLRRRGEVVIDRAIGHLRGNAPTDPPDVLHVPIRYDSLFNIYSAAKCVTSMLVHLCDERGLLHLDDPVAEYIPEFAQHNKGRVTIRHILTHRAGIPAVPGKQIGLEMLADYERILALICAAKPMSVAGRRLSYHALTGGYVLGEIIRRVAGKDLRAFFHDEVRSKLGMATFDYGVARADVDRVAENAFTGAPVVPPYSWMLERSIGVDIHEAARMSNDPRFLTSLVPSANLVGTAEEGSRFFEVLLRNGTYDGAKIFDRRTVRRAVAEQSYLEVDSFLGAPVRYGMGFMLGSNWFSLYGADTPHAFGHIGFTAVAVWADPDRDISVSLMTSGKPFLTPGQWTWLKVARTIARVCPQERP